MGETSIAISIGVGTGQENLGISLTLLTARDSSRVNISSSFQGHPGAIGSLGLVMLGSGKGNVRVEGSNSTVRVGYKAISSENLGISGTLLSPIKTSKRKPSIHNRCGHSEVLCVCEVRVHNSSSLVQSFKMFLCSCGIVRVIRGNCTIGINNQLTGSGCEKRRCYQKLHDDLV